MKCPNCGFESSDNFCALCGTEIPEVMESDSGIIEETKLTETAQSKENLQSAPVNPPVQPQKKSTAFIVTIISVVCVLVVAGTISGLYLLPDEIKNPQKTETTIASETTSDSLSLDGYNEAYNEYSDYYDDSHYYYLNEDFDSITDNDVHPINETAEFPDGMVSVKSCTIVTDDLYPSIKGNTSVWEIKIEIENTSDEELYLDYIYAESTLYDDVCWLTDSITPYNGESIPSGEKLVFFTYFTAEDGIEGFDFYVSFENLNKQYDYTAYFTTIS